MDLFQQRKIYTVWEITSEIKRTLDRLGILWIKGEISNYKHHTSGHMYFCLKDDRSQIKAAFFRGNNAYLKFRPEDGLEVLVRGRLSLYEPRGDYQILVEYMEPVGLGSLQLAFEQLKDKLRRAGLFEDAHKIPLPLLPRKIGVVTSPTGAAIQDILRILKRRNASLHVLLYPVRVQGPGAADEIAAAIRYLNRRKDLDVLIVGRGGGSMEDLWAFNEEVVARAIYDCEIPLISAVGHEVDYTIADFVADMRAPTPSAAAEMVSGAREDLRATVVSLYGRMLQAMRLGLERRRASLDRLAHNRAFNIAPTMVRDLQQRFDEATLRLNQAAHLYLSGRGRRCERAHMRLVKIDLRQAIAHRRDILARHRHALVSCMRADLLGRRGRFELAAGRLDALSPLAILRRGYAICRDESGGIVRDASDVRAGARVDVKLARGQLRCRVENINPETGTPSPEEVHGT